MYHFFEAITNTSGDSLTGYYARVVDPGTGDTIPLYADNAGTPIVNVSGRDDMAVTDDAGNLSFYAEAGTYHLDIYAQNAATFIRRVQNVGMMNGETGPKGDPGPAGNVAADLAQLKAADITNDTMLYDSATFAWTALDYTGQADDVNIIKSDLVDLSEGAWVRQKAVSIQASDGKTVQDNLDHGGYNDDPIFSSAAYLKTTSDIINSEEVNLLRGVPKSEWAAIAAGTSDHDCAAAFASIMSDMDSYGVKGGTLLLPRGKFLVTAPVETGYRASIRGVGSRSSVITAPDGSLDADFPDGVLLLKNQVDATPLLFSSTLRDVQIAANGLAKALTVFGAQENTVVDNILLSQFTEIGFNVPAFLQTTHGASFTNLHIVPLGGSTNAIGMALHDIQKCLIMNVTIDIDQSIAPGYYAHGIKIDGASVDNLFALIHTEDANIGIEEVTANHNRFIQIEANRLSGTSAAHFKSANTTHVIEGIRTIGGFTNQYQNASYSIAASAELRTRRIAPNASGLEYVNGTGAKIILGSVISDASASGAAEIHKGIRVLRGSVGYGGAQATEQIAIPASASVFVEIDTGNNTATNTGFAGTINLDFHTAPTRFNTKAAFSGAVTTTGAMSNGHIGDQYGGTNLTNLTINAPTALSTAALGKFRIEIANNTSSAFSGDVRVEMTQTPNTLKSISVKSS